MITTTQGTFAGDSPFMQRPWTWGYAGIGVDMSRDGQTIIVGGLPVAKTSTSNFTYATG